MSSGDSPPGGGCTRVAVVDHLGAACRPATRRREARLTQVVVVDRRRRRICSSGVIPPPAGGGGAPPPGWTPPVPRSAGPVGNCGPAGAPPPGCIGTPSPSPRRVREAFPRRGSYRLPPRPRRCCRQRSPTRRRRRCGRRGSRHPGLTTKCPPTICPPAVRIDAFFLMPSAELGSVTS